MISDKENGSNWPCNFSTPLLIINKTNPQFFFFFSVIMTRSKYKWTRPCRFRASVTSLPGCIHVLLSRCLALKSSAGWFTSLRMLQKPNNYRLYKQECSPTLLLFCYFLFKISWQSRNNSALEELVLKQPYKSTGAERIAAEHRTKVTLT